MCDKDEFTFTVHVTRHRQSRMVEWALIETGGDAPAGLVECGELPSLPLFLAEFTCALRDHLYGSIRQAAWVSSSVPDNQLSLDEALDQVR